MELTVLGLATDYCVKFTVLDALALGYAVNVITDGCRGVNLQPQDSSQAFMEMAPQAPRSIPLMTGGKPTPDPSPGASAPGLLLPLRYRP